LFALFIAVACFFPLDSASAGQKVEDEDDHCENQQEMDKAAANVEAEAKKPKNEEDYDNRPKHESVSV
jgi:hypothetical protein